MGRTGLVLFCSLLLGGVAARAETLPCLEGTAGCDLIVLDVATGGSHPRIYVGAEYLYWYPRLERVPPLLTTGPVASGGVIGRAGTVILYGDRKIETRHDRLIGVRVSAGWWVDDTHTWAVEGRAFFLERDSSNFTVKPQSALLLARPYINAETGEAAAEIVAGPFPDGSVREGGFNAYSRIEAFGQEANVVRSLWEGVSGRVEGLAGLRFLQMRDRLDLTATAYDLPDRTVLRGVSEHFQTFNKFAGGQAGLRGTLERGRWSLLLNGSVALGGTYENIRTKAVRLTQTPTLYDYRPLGLFVQPSNTGSFTRVTFDAVSEVGVTLGCDVTNWCRLTLGYNVLYWLNPVRSGNQLDVVNTNQILGVPFAGPARPVISFQDDFLWFHGGTAGLEVRW
jgi:hypothetical protein